MGLNPSAQHIANQKAASGRVLQSLRASIAWSNAFSGDMGRREDERACSRAGFFSRFSTISAKAATPAQPPKNTQLLRIGTAPASCRSDDQAAADVRVVSQSVVASDVGLPERSQAPAAPARGEGCRGRHRPGRFGLPGGRREPCSDHGQRVGDVLEQKPGVGEVEGTPFLIPKGKIEGVARPELDQSRLRRRRQACLSGLFELAGVALDPDDRPVGPAARAMARVNWAIPLPTSRIVSPP